MSTDPHPNPNPNPNPEPRRFGDDVEFGYIVTVPGPEGPQELQLQSKLYMTRQGFGRKALTYPATITQARYGGTHEGGAGWLAFPVHPHVLSRSYWEDWDTSDNECAEWWSRAALENWAIGRGATPGDSYDNLLNALCQAAGVERSRLEADPAWPARVGDRDVPLIVPPGMDGIMSCPCGRGDYQLCQSCPYPACSVHGQAGWEGDAGA